MIFVTVGVQLPFDRLIRAVDEWAEKANRSDVVAQVGASTYSPKRLTVYAQLAIDEFKKFVEQAEVVVAHAGMGSIITALELGKPIIIMPRLASLGEHRNDHQLATAAHMAAQKLINVAHNQEELLSLLDKVGPLEGVHRANPHASPELLNTVKSFIQRVDHRERRKATVFNKLSAVLNKIA